MARLLVTGATGRIGRRVAAHLAREGAELRLLVRDPSQAPPVPGAHCVPGDFGDLAAMAQAFEGVQTAFLYTPARPDPRLLRLAADQGVAHVVLLSSASVGKVGADDPNPVAARHRMAEQAVRDAGLRWTFLRPDVLAANCLQWAEAIRTERRVRVPYPESLRNPIHEDDVALATALAMREPERWHGRVLTLTGPACLTLRQQVEAIGQAIGTALECVPISPEEALQAMTSGHPPMPAEVARRLIEYMRKTTVQPPEVTRDFSDAVGRPARPFADWAKDHAGDFLPLQAAAR